MAVMWIVRSVNAEPVEAARPHVREEAVPDLIRPFAEHDLVLLDRIIGPVEQAELDRRRVLGEEREVDTLAIPRGSEWVGKTRPDSHSGLVLQAGEGTRFVGNRSEEHTSELQSRFDLVCR